MSDKVGSSDERQARFAQLHEEIKSRVEELWALSNSGAVAANGKPWSRYALEGDAISRLTGRGDVGPMKHMFCDADGNCVCYTQWGREVGC